MTHCRPRMAFHGSPTGYVYMDEPTGLGIARATWLICFGIIRIPWPVSNSWPSNNRSSYCKSLEVPRPLNARVVVSSVSRVAIFRSDRCRLVPSPSCRRRTSRSLRLCIVHNRENPLLAVFLSRARTRTTPLHEPRTHPPRQYSRQVWTVRSRSRRITGLVRGGKRVRTTPSTRRRCPHPRRRKMCLRREERCQP